jgi:predicted NBD/HSP70 family sugar kinase
MLMYLAVDIGGSKTLLAVFSEEGKKLAQTKIKTPKDYKKFLAEIKEQIEQITQEYKISSCCCAVPGRLDRHRGVAFDLGNLSWHNVPIKKDIAHIMRRVPVSIENDANLAGLSEVGLVREKYKKVLYLTVSTGIRGAVIIHGKINPDLIDGEAGKMVLEHEGKLKPWEDFASGRALMQKYGKLASEINDPGIWSEFSRNLALGLNILLSIVQPEVVIIGGGVGAHYDKFGDKLEEELKKMDNKMVPVPPIVQAKRPEEAVIYGCYEYIKQN